MVVRLHLSFVLVLSVALSCVAQRTSTFTSTSLAHVSESLVNDQGSCKLVGSRCTFDPLVLVHGRSRRLEDNFGVCNEALKCVVPMPTCNDGTPYVFYKNLNASSSNWIVFLMGGGYCFDDASCIDRKKTMGYATSSRSFQSQRVFPNGIMSGDDNPFASWNRIFLPYCTSDAFSGTRPFSKTGAGFSFLGKYVVPAVLQNLVQHQGLTDSPSTTFILSGSSAGAVSIYSNIAFVSESLPLSKTLAVVDSGWFLDSDPYITQSCATTMECTEQGIFQRGVDFWQAGLDPGCASHYSGDERWRCYLGKYVVPWIEPSMFIFQWQFDQAQLQHDGITSEPSAGTELQYSQKSAGDLIQSFQQANTTTTHHHFFSPACYYHTVLNRLVSWTSQTAGQMSLVDALKQFVSDPSTVIFEMDSCVLPGCNPNCPGNG